MSDKIEADSGAQQPPAVASSELLGAMYRGSDGAWTCALCHHEMEWEECHSVCDDGYFDGYEDDPIYYQPGEMIACSNCRGEGGTWWCPNKECPTHEAWERIPAPQAPNDPDQRPPT